MWQGNDRYVIGTSNQIMEENKNTLYEIFINKALTDIVFIRQEFIDITSWPNRHQEHIDTKNQ